MGKSWSEQEAEFCKQNYGEMKMSELSKKLNRTPQSIYSFARTNNLTKGKRRQLEIPKKIENQTIEEIAKALENAIVKEEKELLERISYIQSYKQLINK